MQLAEPVSPIERWALDPSIVHLNHGSYGGCPRAVIDAATAWRVRLESAPMRFLVLEWQDELDRARAALAAFLNAPVDRLAFVQSSTSGVAIALASIGPRLVAGDRILATDHGYRACRNQLERLASARGLAIDTVVLPSPFDAGELVQRVRRAITPHTKLALIDHVTSPSALRLPLEAIVDALAGVTIVVDGAHAPGQLELDVTALLARGVAYYVGNCHKWMCAPKGTGFVAIRDGEPAVPVVTSHGASAAYGPPNRLHAELDWSGTHDPSAHLAVPAAIAAVAGEGHGWPHVRTRNHALAIELARRFCDAMGGAHAPLPAHDAVGAMVAIPVELPPGAAPFALEQALLAAGWEIPIVDFATGPLVRLSAHLYNHAGEADLLARELRDRGVRLR